MPDLRVLRRRRQAHSEVRSEFDKDMFAPDPTLWLKFGLKHGLLISASRLTLSAQLGGTFAASCLSKSCDKPKSARMSSCIYPVSRETVATTAAWDFAIFPVRAAFKPLPAGEDMLLEPLPLLLLQVPPGSAPETGATEDEDGAPEEDPPLPILEDAVSANE